MYDKHLWKNKNFLDLQMRRLSQKWFNGLK